MAAKKRGEGESLTTRVLVEIRDAIKRNTERLEARLGETNERIDQTNARVGETNEHIERLERRQTETEVRLATEIVAVAGAVHEVRDYLKEAIALRPTLDDHELRLRALESKRG